MKITLRYILISIALFLVCVIIFGGGYNIYHNRVVLKDPCYRYNYIDSMHDENYSKIFVYCANREINATKNILKFYFSILPKDANFTSEEQIIVDKAKRIIDDELLSNSNK